MQGIEAVILARPTAAVSIQVRSLASRDLT